MNTAFLLIAATFLLVLVTAASLITSPFVKFMFGALAPLMLVLAFLMVALATVKTLTE